MLWRNVTLSRQRLKVVVSHFNLITSLLTSESATGKMILVAGSTNKVDKDRVIRRTLGGTRDTILVSLSDAKGRGTSRHRPSRGSR